MTKPMRETMPHTAEAIDQLREIFGAASINRAIRRGVEGLPGGLHAIEGDKEFGHETIYRGRWVHAGEMVLDTKQLQEKLNKGRRHG